MTPDASQFTQFQRMRPIQDQKRKDNKVITHLWQPTLTTNNLKDFLPSFSSKLHFKYLPYSGFHPMTPLKSNQHTSYTAGKYIK